MNYKKSNVLITGLIRNGEKTIEDSINKLLESFSFFNETYFYVVESDSNDNTVKILEKISKKVKNFKYVTLGALQNKIRSRVKRITYCRNYSLDYIKKNNDILNNPYVVVSDLDGVISKINKKKILSCFELKNQWSVLTANQSDFYYDIWALRHQSWSNDDCWNSYNFFLNELKLGHYKSYNRAVRSKQIRIDKFLPPIRVNSAFGGLAIYKPNVYVKSYYEENTTENNYISCEHVAFHEKLIKKGFKIFINPKLIIGRAPKKHIPNKLYVIFYHILLHLKLINKKIID
tara:strand:+ start:13758 stop:14624 length:867 start_codon:yes stop_codon:yes gene_type:complete